MTDPRTAWRRAYPIVLVRLMVVMVGVFGWALWRRVGIDGAIVGVCINISVAACMAHLCVGIARQRAGDSGRESNIRWVIRTLNTPMRDSAGR